MIPEFSFARGSAALNVGSVAPSGRRLACLITPEIKLTLLRLVSMTGRKRMAILDAAFRYVRPCAAFADYEGPTVSWRGPFSIESDRKQSALAPRSGTSRRRPCVASARDSRVERSI